MAGAGNGTSLSQAHHERDVAGPLASRYRRREPERTLLHATVRAHWKTFLAEVEERGEAGTSLPRFVMGEFERYLACGITEWKTDSGARTIAARPDNDSVWNEGPLTSISHEAASGQRTCRGR